MKCIHQIPPLRPQEPSGRGDRKTEDYRHQREMEQELQKQWGRHLYLGDTSHIDDASDEKVIASIVTEKK